eukprot:6228705-Pyramimonas_sp.AAC.1
MAREDSGSRSPHSGASSDRTFRLRGAPSEEAAPPPPPTVTTAASSSAPGLSVDQEGRAGGQGLQAGSGSVRRCGGSCDEHEDRGNGGCGSKWAGG